MNPRTLVRLAALQALATAAASGDPDFAPLVNARVALGQTWPSQSPNAGQGPLPNQLLIYGWDEESESLAEKSTNPQFDTTMGLTIEARVETDQAAATAKLPAQPSPSAVAAAIDGAIDALCYAVKKAICQGIQVAAQALNASQNQENKPVITWIRKVQTTSKLNDQGQRIAGNGGILFDLVYGEYFEPVITTELADLDILIQPQAGSTANEGNTGNGTISSIGLASGTEPGTYVVLFTSATAYEVTSPDSTPAGTGTVGQSFSGGGLTFTIGAGTVAFVAGDGFSIDVQVATQTQLNLS